jgi:acyl carrier protein
MVTIASVTIKTRRPQRWKLRSGRRVVTTALMSTFTADVRGEIVHELSELTGIQAESLTADATLQELDIDSLDLAEFKQVVEDRYDVQLDRDAFTGVVTVGHALDVMLARLGRA